MNYIKHHKSKILLILITFVIVNSALLYWCNDHVNKTTVGYLYKDLNEIPANKVGLLLGTSKYLNSGEPNPYFYNRIKAASALFFSGKIRYIIVSGDNRFTSYNEPREMRRELMKAGIPDTSIILDFAGFRTLDSVVRGNKIFGQRKFTIISQEFHNERAIYIARFNGIEAIGYNAEDPVNIITWKVQTRELFARTMMMIDLYILRSEPYFLGDPVKIPGI